MANIVNLLGLMLVLVTGVSSLLAGHCWISLAAGAVLTGTGWLMERG